MDHGSLYDLLRNETVVLDAEIIVPIIRDICKGVRFLHTATPQVIHQDLKGRLESRVVSQIYTRVRQAHREFLSLSNSGQHTCGFPLSRQGRRLRALTKERTRSCWFSLLDGA